MEYLYNLEPQYDNANSFYGKARVYRDDKGHLFLESYSTIVAEITDGIATEDGRKRAKVYGWYSRTTARHINDFLYQHGFKTMNKKEMEAN
jgi:hypothetical protein